MYSIPLNNDYSEKCKIMISTEVQTMQYVPKAAAVKAPTTADVCMHIPEYHGPERELRLAHIADKLATLNATLVAHYYVHEDIQELADKTGGFVGDSLEMAKFGQQTAAETLVVAGVRFMGETAKILNPEKRVLMPTLDATCSLDLSCPTDQFASFCKQHPDRVVVVYANTSAEVKALADWVVTSSNAVEIVSHLMDRNEKILWAPDRYLGRYIQKMSGADMLLWQGSCVVHEEFKYRGVLELKQHYPDAAVLVHPESPEAVIDIADAVGSTSALIKAAVELPNERFIVATDNRIFYKMKQLAKNKEFIEAPTAGEGATCKSCAHCPWMAMNGLDNLERTLDRLDNEINIPETIRRDALRSTRRMIEFSNTRH